MGRIEFTLFFQSAAVYLLTAFLLFALGHHASNRELKLEQTSEGHLLPFYCWENCVSMLVVGLLMGLRYNTGSDFPMYLREFLKIQDGGSFTRADFEPLFRGITWLFAKSGLHYSVYFGFFGVLQMGLLCLGLNRRKSLMPWVGMFLILGPYAVGWFSFMRQWTVSFLFVAIIPLIEKRKLILYALFVLIGMTFHKSAWILIIFYFVPHTFFAKKSLRMLLIIFSACVLLGLYPFWLRLLKYVSEVVEWMGYGKYEYVLTPLSNGNFVFRHWGPLHIITIFTELVAICYYPKIKEFYKNDSFLPICFSIMFIGVCYENLFMNTLYFMLRPCEYIYIFVIITTGYICNYLYVTKKKTQLAILVCISCSYVMLSVLKSLILHSTCTKMVYNFFFLK